MAWFDSGWNDASSIRGMLPLQHRLSSVGEMLCCISSFTGLLLMDTLFYVHMYMGRPRVHMAARMGERSPWGQIAAPCAYECVIYVCIVSIRSTCRHDRVKIVCW